MSAPLPSAPMPANDTTPDLSAGDVPPELLPFVEAMVDLCLERLVRPREVASRPPENDR